MEIVKTTDERQHSAICGTCEVPGGGVRQLTPNGVDTAGRGPDAAARAHLMAFPDHEVSVTYVGAVIYTVDPRDMRYPEGRPGWLGSGQPWPCGRCGSEEGDETKHDCQPKRS